MKTKWLAIIGAVFLFAELTLVLTSWILSATMMEGVRSLLSSEGIRWYFGSFTEMVASPLLVWLLLLLSALGCFQKSGAVALLKGAQLTYRERTAFRVSLMFVAIYLGIFALLTLMPHAILLSATGSLFPSAFSRSLVPSAAFGICLFSVVYGMMSGRMKSLPDILDALSFGIAQGAPLLILYILFIQLYESFRFVFLSAGIA